MIEFTDDQVYGLYDGEHWWRSASSDQVFEISGGPGTGKTFLVKHLINRLGLDAEKEVLFVAYMGKAAMQLSRTGLQGRTIHSAFYDFVQEYVRDENMRIVKNEKGKPKIKNTFRLKDHLPKRIKLIVIDEGSMVEKKMAEDILSFGIPVIVLGDLDQLPPVFGKPYFLKKPNVILRKIMRQAENDPIVYLCGLAKSGRRLPIGVYGKSAVIPRKDITDFHLKQPDVILTGTNRLRWNINNYMRTEIKQIRRLEYPHVGEKVICRKNNWKECVDDGIYLTNGLAGYVEYIYRESFNKKTMKMDFHPDFTKQSFKNIVFDYNHMYAVPGQDDNEETPFGYLYDKFEFAYALTVHAVQGSQYDKVLFLNERFLQSDEDHNKFQYTAISRAIESVTVVM